VFAAAQAKSRSETSKKEHPMNAQNQVKRQRSRGALKPKENGFAVPSPWSPSFQPAEVTWTVPMSLSTVWEGGTPTHEEIAQLAYRLWEVNGRPAHTDRDDWMQAEELLRLQM
jgi:hypothetical protein